VVKQKPFAANKISNQLARRDERREPTVTKLIAARNITPWWRHTGHLLFLLLLLC